MLVQELGRHAQSFGDVRLKRRAVSELRPLPMDVVSGDLPGVEGPIVSLACEFPGSVLFLRVGHDQRAQCVGVEDGVAGVVPVEIPIGVGWDEAEANVFADPYAEDIAVGVGSRVDEPTCRGKRKPSKLLRVVDGPSGCGEASSVLLSGQCGVGLFEDGGVAFVDSVDLISGVREDLTDAGFDPGQDLPRADGGVSLAELAVETLFKAQ